MHNLLIVPTESVRDNRALTCPALDVEQQRAMEALQRSSTSKAPSKQLGGERRLSKEKQLAAPRADHSPAPSRVASFRDFAWQHGAPHHPHAHHQYRSSKNFHEVLQELGAIHELDLSHARSEVGRLQLEVSNLRRELGKEDHLSHARPEVVRREAHAATATHAAAATHAGPLRHASTQPPDMTPPASSETRLLPNDRVEGDMLSSVETQPIARDDRRPPGSVESARSSLQCAAGSDEQECESIQEVPTRLSEVLGMHRFLSSDFTEDFRALPVWKMEDSAISKGSQKLNLCRASTVARPSHDRTSEDLVIRGTSCMQKFLVHPHSFKRLAWDLMSMTFLAYDIIMIPFSGAFNPEVTPFTTGMNWTTMLFWSLDMVASVLTGYQDGRHAVLEPKRILKHYFRTWFVLDVLIVGLDWTLLFLGDSNAAGGSAARLGRSLRTLRFVRTLRLIRLLKIKRILQEIQDQINTEALSICFGISKIILVLVLANHIVACCWYGIGEMGAEDVEPGQTNWVVEHSMADRTLMYRYSTSLHWSLTQFTPASMEVVPYNVMERSFSVIVLLFAMITFSSFVSILTASMAELRNISSDETRQFWLLRRYLRDWHVSRRFAIRIQRYLEYAYQKQRQRVQAKDVKLLSLLSGPLHDELKYETLSVHLAVHPLFQQCAANMRLFAKAVSEMWLARGDCIFCCGEQASSMTFLSSGNFQYHLGDTDSSLGDSGPVSVLMGEGQWVAEAVLWTPWLHLGDLVALTESQVMAINGAQFGDAVQVHKPMWLGFRRYAERFVTALNKVRKEDLTDLLYNVMNSGDCVEESDFFRSSMTSTEEEDTEMAFGRHIRFFLGRRQSRVKRGFFTSERSNSLKF